MLRTAFSLGLRQTLHNWRLLLPLLLTSIVLGLVNIWPLYLALGSGATHLPFTRNVANDLGSSFSNLVIGIGLTTIGTIGTVWVIGLVLAAVLFGLAYNFFSGGILSRYAGTHLFWEGCRRYFWTFTGLGVFAVIVLAVLGTLGDYVARRLGAGLVVRGSVLVVVVQIINMVFEYARALAVAYNQRNPLAALRHALDFCGRHLGGVVVLALLAGVLFVALAAIYNLVAGLLAPLTLVGLLIVWQQLFVLGQQAIKLLRLSWALAYVQTARPVFQPSNLATPLQVV